MDIEARDLLNDVDRIIDAIRDARLTAETLELMEIADFFARSDTQYTKMRGLMNDAVLDLEGKLRMPS